MSPDSFLCSLPFLLLLEGFVTWTSCMSFGEICWNEWCYNFSWEDSLGYIWSYITLDKNRYSHVTTTNTSPRQLSNSIYWGRPHKHVSWTLYWESSTFNFYVQLIIFTFLYKVTLLHHLLDFLCQEDGEAFITSRHFQSSARWFSQLSELKPTATFRVENQFFQWYLGRKMKLLSKNNKT